MMSQGAYKEISLSVCFFANNVVLSGVNRKMELWEALEFKG
jgi:hypothetical protein